MLAKGQGGGRFRRVNIVDMRLLSLKGPTLVLVGIWELGT